MKGRMFARRAVLTVVALAVCVPFVLGPRLAATAPSSPRGTNDLDRLSALIRGSRFVEAAALATTLLDSAPTDARTLALCGLALLNAGHITASQRLFERAIAKVPDTPEAHLGLGRIARARNNGDTALAHLQRTLASSDFYDEALKQLWAVIWERGDLPHLRRLEAVVTERFKRLAKPWPAWLSNSHLQIEQTGKPLFQVEGATVQERVRLGTVPASPGIRTVTLKLNRKGPYPFDIDSAYADFMTISPLLADELRLSSSGLSMASGVGTETAAIRFSRLDRVELGGVTFCNVPVKVSDLSVFRGLKKGLIGTGLLKRFNVTIDVEANQMDLLPLERPDLLAIDRTRVVADVPLYIFDATVVEATIGRAPAALYILDSAAATHLIDRGFFDAHLRSSVDPSRITRSQIRGAQGAEWTTRVDGLPIRLGSIQFPWQSVHEFSMDKLNTARYAAGVIGNPVLWPYRVHMDFRNGRLILERRN